ncbi:MAG: flavin reductase family protein [Arenicella sp.]
MQIDFSTLSPNQIYHTMIQTIIPRPIAWILSENDNSTFNLAPFSYFNAVSSSPPLLLISIGRKSKDNPKDTVANIRSTGKFVVHIAHQDLAEPLNSSAATLAYGESELTTTQLETAAFDTFSLPRIKDAPIAFACELYELQEIGNTPMSLVFGEIKYAYISDTIATQDGKHLKVLADQLNPLSRLGGNDYCGLGKTFTLPRPK